MCLGRDAYKFFNIFTGKRCHSLWLSSHNSSRLRGFFWWTLLFSSVHICSMIFKSGFWAGQFFNMVASPSARLCCVAHDLWHEAPSCWKIVPSSKFGVKWSFSNWMYLALFKLPSILINFLGPSLLCIPKASDSYFKLHCFRNVGCFAFLYSSLKWFFLWFAKLPLVRMWRKVFLSMFLAGFQFTSGSLFT